MRIALITPALVDANNGNWQTAQRWAAMLGSAHSVELAKSVSDLTSPLIDYDSMIALHARRSADSIAQFAAYCPTKPLIVVLTGTDLYRDIATDVAAQMSIERASVLVVLQEQGVFDLPAHLRHKTRVVFQSAERLPRLPKLPRKKTLLADQSLKIAAVGHLRAEKSPETTLAVASFLAQNGLDSCIQHVGNLLDVRYESELTAVQAAHPKHYQWLGGLNHADSLVLIANSDVLFHPSAMEGGALAIIEAIQCCTPVIASRVAGHIGLLGSDYEGFFEWGDAKAAAMLLTRYAQDSAYQMRLLAQCNQRSALFDPDTERQTLLNLFTI